MDQPTVGVVRPFHLCRSQTQTPKAPIVTADLGSLGCSRQWRLADRSGMWNTDDRESRVGCGGIIALYA